MSSSTLYSFWNEQASATRPGNRSRQKASTSSALSDSTSGGSCRVAAKQDLLQRVPAQPETQRLERDDLLGRDVAEVHLGAEVPHEPRLRRFRRRLPDDVVEIDRVRDLVDEAGAHLAGGTEDAGGAALARLGDHLPGAGVALLLDPLHPLVRRVDDLGVLRADLGEDGEVAGEVGDQLELALARDRDGAVGDLDVREAVLEQPALELVELVPGVHRLEQGAATDDRRVERAVEGDLLLEVVRHVAGAPAELDD